MAVALDSNSAVASSTNETSHNYSFTNSAGTFLLVWLVADSAITNPTCTWNGTSLTLVSSQAADVPNVYLFKLVSPATGSQTLAVSWTSTARVTAVFMTFTGAGDIGTADKANMASGTTNLTTTATIANVDILAGVAGYTSTATNIAVVTGTERAEATGVGTTSNGATNTGTGSVSIVWSRSVAAAAAYIGVPVIALASVTVSPSVISVVASVQAPTVAANANVTISAAISVVATVQAPTVTTPASKWTNTSKTTSTATNTTKNAATFTNTTKTSPGTISNTTKS